MLHKIGVRMNKKLFVSLLLIFISAIYIGSCSDDSIPTVPDSTVLFNENLTIVTDKSEYSFDTDFYNSYGTVTATLTNTTQDTFYSKIGDGFNAAIDHEVLFFAYQNDGYFEYNIENDSWEITEQGRLIEGSKIIRILPSVNYIIHAPSIIDSNKLGKYRLRIHYYKNSDGVGDTLRDISNIFSIIN